MNHESQNTQHKVRITIISLDTIVTIKQENRETFI